MKELIESVGAEVLFLPPYWPDFSPIEEAFSKVKGILRRIGARTPAKPSRKRPARRSLP